MAKKTDGKQTEPAAQASGARRFRSNGRLFFTGTKDSSILPRLTAGRMPVGKSPSVSSLGNRPAGSKDGVIFAAINFHWRQWRPSCKIGN